ncbi:unnamed protein product [Bathycoccus prasinos]
MSYTRLTNDGENDNDANKSGILREAISTHANRVQSLIFQLQTNVSTFKRLVDQLGTARDTKDQRAKLHKLRESIGQMAKESSVLVKKLARLVTDLVHEEQDQEVRTTGGKNNNSAAADVAMSGERGGQFYQGGQMVDEEQQHAPLLMEHKSQGQKEMTAVEIDMRFNDQLIEERERGIAEIQQQIGEVNEIFQDLAVLVNEQGNMIDDIEANIVSTAVRTKEAQKELTKADKSQKSARNKMVCLAITVFTALIILILFLLQ